MRGGYQIIDLSTATIGSESIINEVYQTIKHFDGKPVFIITPNTSGVFAEFTENNGMYIGAYIGSNSHLYTVSIISSNRVTITDKGPAGGGGTSNYNELSNKPAIAGTTLSGDKPLSDFGIQGALIAGSNISIDANNEISANVDSIAASSVTYNNTSSGMTANNVQEAITELNSNKSNKSWTLAGNVQGNTAIDLPSGWSELHCEVYSGETAWPLTIIYTGQTTTRWYVAGSGGASTELGQYSISIQLYNSNSKIRLHFVYIDNVAKTSDYYLRVYYR